MCQTRMTFLDKNKLQGREEFAHCSILQFRQGIDAEVVNGSMRGYRGSFINLRTVLLQQNIVGSLIIASLKFGSSIYFHMFQDLCYLTVFVKYIP